MDNVIIKKSTAVNIAFGIMVFSGVMMAIPGFVHAEATLFISPGSGNYTVGDLFSVLVNVNSGGEAINAAAAQINFDNNKLEVTSIGYTRLLFILWTEEPAFSNAAGTIRFSGGLPNPGFTGVSGSVLRITFRARAQGTASVTFMSGSILANDGKGTNILSGFREASFIIISGGEKSKEYRETSAPQTPKLSPTFQPAQKPLSVPIITDWPKQLEEGSILTIKGLGVPNGKVLISIQKGVEDPVIEEVFAGPDGRFSFTYSKRTISGFYRLWAKNVTPDAVSGSSEILTIEVRKPLITRIGTLALNFASIIITLLGLLLLAVLALLWSWYKVKRWRYDQRKEIYEVEDTLHKAIDMLKKDIREQVKLLFRRARSKRKLTDKKERMIEQLSRDLDVAEKFVRKEIEDIEIKK